MKNFSTEYIETICDWMDDFKRDPDNIFVPQFLNKHGIGWSYMQELITASEQIKNAFDVMIAALCCRWMDIAMVRSHNVSKNFHSLISRYLELYDNHAFLTNIVRNHSKSSVIQENKMEKQLRFEKENFSKKSISKEYQNFWDANEEKLKVPKQKAKN